MPHSRTVSRRQFIKRSSLAGAAVLGFPAFVRAKSPSEKLNIAVIGCGGRGGANLREMMGENVVALCDVNEANLGRAAEKAPRAKTFRDFRRLYDDLRDGEFDAVVVSTTEHTHAFATLPALQRKKHVYCEKPLAHNVYEARLAAETARKNKRVTQMGIQIHAEKNYRRTVELIRSGAIGPVSEVHCFIKKVWSPVNDPPREEQPVPEGLNWDAWLGPAPEQPYRTNMHPANWRKWWEFGNGTLGDMGCHYMDLPFWALDLKHPTRVSAEGPPVDSQGTPPWLTVHYEFPARGEQPPVKLHWYDGEDNKPKQYAEWDLPPMWENGVVFIGTEGRYLFADYSQRRLFPARRYAQFQAPPKSIPDSPGHHKEWIRACLANDPSKSSCNFDYSGPLSEAVLLGTVAYRVGKTLEWEAKNLRATNAPEATKYLRREYRKGWELNVG